MISEKTENCRYFKDNICVIMYTNRMDCTKCMAFRSKDEPLVTNVIHDIDPDYDNNNED